MAQGAKGTRPAVTIWREGQAVWVEGAPAGALARLRTARLVAEEDALHDAVDPADHGYTPK